MSPGLLAAGVVAVLIIPVVAVLLAWMLRGHGRHSDKKVI